MFDLLHEVPEHLLMLILILCVCAGWLLDSAMGDRGVGMIGNTIFLTAGAAGGLLFADHIGTNLEKDFLTAISLAVAGAIWVLLTVCFIKSRWAI